MRKTFIKVKINLIFIIKILKFGSHNHAVSYYFLPKTRVFVEENLTRQSYPVIGPVCWKVTFLVATRILYYLKDRERLV